ncbi:MAG: PKD domain-containing protein [Actinomycetes bacterium]
MRALLRAGGTVFVGATLAAGAMTLPAAADGSTWYTDGNDPACSDAGPGTTSQPFCSLKQGANSAISAGDTLVIRAATYREQLTVGGSGTAAAPITIMGEPGSVVLGTTNLSDAGGWSPATATAWTRAYAPSSAPTQVFVGEQRLPAAASLAGLGKDSFYFDAGAQQIYVDVGGANPAVGSQVEAGAWTYGVNVASRSHVIVSGLESQRANNTGFRVASSNDVSLVGDSATQAGSYGIHVQSCPSAQVTVRGSVARSNRSVGIRVSASSDVLIKGNTSSQNWSHGIALSGSSAVSVTGNTSTANANPAARSATGIDVNSDSDNNQILANTTVNNQDSGIQIYNGSDNNLAARNLSTDNGDHGIDNVRAIGSVLTNNTLVGNYKDGISLEGSATNGTIRNNVSVNNGLTTGEYDLYVDASSTPGFSADHDLLWKSAPGTVIKYAGVNYSSLAAFRSATGHESHGIDANPGLRGLQSNDYRPDGNSPVIDAADASAPGFALPDILGQMAVDDPAAADSGVGSPAFADIGAYEYAGPAATWTVSPTEGPEPLTVSFDATGSVPLGAPITSIRIDFGDGTSPSSGPAAQHTYNTGGRYVATVTVQDADGFVDTAAQPIQVTVNQPPKASLTRSPNGKVGVGTTVTLLASKSFDPENLPLTYQFDCDNGYTVGPQPGATATCTYTKKGNYLPSVTVTDSGGLTATASKGVNVK